MKLLAILIVTFAGFSSFADLQVFPLRVVLSEKHRDAQVSLRHKGEKPERYRISTIFYKMSPNGAMTPIEKPKDTDRFAAKYIRYSPRQVLLEPNVEQVVRLATRLPADLPKGEYRAHLHFEAVDDPNEKKENDKDTKGATMVLKSKMAVAIPIIVRKGGPEAKVTLKDLKTVMDSDKKLAFEVGMIKEGDASVYGDIEVFHTPAGGSEVSVGAANGVSTYIPFRIVHFPLQVEKLGPGKLRLVFRQPASDGGVEIASVETTIH